MCKLENRAHAERQGSDPLRLDSLVNTWDDEGGIAMLNGGLPSLNMNMSLGQQLGVRPMYPLILALAVGVSCNPSTHTANRCSACCVVCSMTCRRSVYSLFACTQYIGDNR